MTQDDKHIFGMKNVGIPDHIIAAKLGISINEVRRRHRAILDTFNSLEENGVDHLIHAFNTTCLQYQMVGEGLKSLGENLCNPVTPQEVREQLTDDPDQTVKNLMASFIILRPWSPPLTHTGDTKDEG